MVEIQIGRLRATAVGWEWTTGDHPLLTTLRQDAEVRPYTGYDPFPALTLAEEAIQRYGGRIVAQQPPAYVAGRVY